MSLSGVAEVRRRRTPSNGEPRSILVDTLSCWMFLSASQAHPDGPISPFPNLTLPAEMPQLDHSACLEDMHGSISGTLFDR